MTTVAALTPEQQSRKTALSKFLRAVKEHEDATNRVKNCTLTGLHRPTHTQRHKHTQSDIRIRLYVVRCSAITAEWAGR